MKTDTQNLFEMSIDAENKRGIGQNLGKLTSLEIKSVKNEKLYFKAFNKEN